MRFVLYNIAYGTGSPQSYYQGLLTLHRYLKPPRRHLERIRDFALKLNPDILGLVEIDAGSVRCGRRSQVIELARALTHSHRFGTKYGERSVYRLLPVFRFQGNAILAREEPVFHQQHFLRAGWKRLVVETHVLGVRVFLVHLSLNRRARHEQLRNLAHLIGHPDRPVLLAGDFNTFAGRQELEPLLRATGLRNPNADRHPTYPCYTPRRELDFVLCSPQIRVRHFEVLADVRLSDHLPLLLDFDL